MRVVKCMIATFAFLFVAMIAMIPAILCLDCTLPPWRAAIVFASCVVAYEIIGAWMKWLEREINGH